MSWRPCLADFCSCTRGQALAKGARCQGCSEGIPRWRGVSEGIKLALKALNLWRCIQLFHASVMEWLDERGASVAKPLHLMHPKHRCPSRTSSLLKALAVYLAAILFVQSLAAAHALGAGPLHQHQPAPFSEAAMVFSHHHAHAHAHASGQRHHHAADDITVLRDAADQEVADAATLALAAALSCMALQTPHAEADTRRHLLCAAPHWSWQTTHTHPLYRPPSQG